ncbi:hypothetical protein AAVH_20191 [Aphelenchoides avenae]|nr:hypothetical protein AAVH_20191 [Aphelenchus avenae]
MVYHLLLSLALLDPKSPKVLELANHVTAKVQATIKVSNCLVLEEVYNATQQTVAGYMYRLNLRASHSTCRQPDCAKKIKWPCPHLPYPIPDLNIKASVWQKVGAPEEIKFVILK